MEFISAEFLGRAFVAEAERLGQAVNGRHCYLRLALQWSELADEIERYTRDSARTR